jgi:hypothetical protein
MIQMSKPRTIGTLISNNAYDGLVITDALNGSRLHRFADGEAFREALVVGDKQDIDNWSGESLDDGVTPEDCGTVLATNDGEKLTIVDERLLDRRREFWSA